MKKICWLATGGTIASRPSENGLVPGFTAKEMLEMVPKLKDYGHIDCYDIMQLDSTNLQPEDWQYIAGYIEKLYELDMVDTLDDKLKEVIEYRMKYKESSLSELANIISSETGVEITKSGLNHRFRKIKEILENYLKEKEKSK